MSQAELGAFLHSAREIEKNAQGYRFFALQYLFGLRVGEVVALRFEHMGPLGANGLPTLVNVPTLKKRKVGPHGSVLLPVPVLGSPKLVLHCFDKARCTRRLKDSPWLFPGQDPSNHMSTSTAILWFHQIADAAYLSKGYTPHTLRHTAISRVMDKTGDRIRLASAFARHSMGSGRAAEQSGGAAVTWKYIHVRSEELLERYPGILDLPDLRPLAR